MVDHTIATDLVILKARFLLHIWATAMDKSNQPDGIDTVGLFRLFV